MSTPAIPVLRGKAGAQGYAHDAIILAPDTRYREWILQIRTMQVASEDFTTPDVGQRFQLPRFLLQPVSSPDSDGDGLHDLAEFILGTNPTKTDTDGDGVKDGAEVLDGTDPLDGLPASIGIIAATDTPGTAADVCAINDIAIVANREAGVSVLNVAGQNAVRIAEVDTPGTALRVACSGNLIAVADGPAGLAIIDITDPPAARITNQVNLGASAQAITAGGVIAFVGLANGELVAVDLPTAAVLSRRSLGAPVQDLVLSGDHLLAVTSGALLVLNPYEVDLPTLGSIGTSGALRLVAGNGVAYVTVGGGFDVFTIGTNALPTLLRQNRPGQLSWSHIVANGSGFGIAATRVNFAGSHEIELYSLPAPNQPPQFTTQINTPGDATAISIYNGRAYVADGASGLQVINYLAYDDGTNPPSIALSTSFVMSSPTNGVAEEGKLARVTASVTDDRQVRNVEFYIDGVRVLTDGNFPFEHRLITPRLTATKTNFTVRAKATDTGGNFAWSDEIRVALTPDATPPRVLGTVPDSNTVITQATDTVIAYFNEPMEVGTLNGGSFYVVSAGPDNVLGNTNDFVLPGVVTWRETLNAAVLAFRSPLPFGIYRAVLTPSITDTTGKALTNQFAWTFAYISTGPEGDDDGDDVTNSLEILVGTNPFLADTDNDGWSDRIEIDDGTDPLNPNSRPNMTFVARPPVLVDLPSAETFGTTGVGTYLARPTVLIDLPSPETFGIEGSVVFVARPPVEVCIPSPETFGTAGAGTYVARPPVLVDLPSPEMFGIAGAPVYLARPPLLIDLPSADTAGIGGLGLFLARPPISIIITNSPGP